MITPVQHTDGSTVLLDTEEFVYYRLPETEGKIVMNGKLYNYCKTIEAFFQSPHERAIIPVWCEEKEQVRRRVKVRFISGQKIGEFFNIERINEKWATNEIELCEKKKAYFVYFVKDKMAVNDCRVLGVKEIIKNRANA